MGRWKYPRTVTSGSTLTCTVGMLAVKRRAAARASSRSFVAAMTIQRSSMMTSVIEPANNGLNLLISVEVLGRIGKKRPTESSSSTLCTATRTLESRHEVEIEHPMRCQRSTAVFVVVLRVRLRVVTSCGSRLNRKLRVARPLRMAASIQSQIPTARGIISSPIKKPESPHPRKRAPLDPILSFTISLA